MSHQNAATASTGEKPLDDQQERAIVALRGLLQAGDLYRTKVANYFGLGWTELQAVGHLVAAGELGHSELAHRLAITTGAATALVDRLERVRLAARHPHPQDRRRSMVRLSPEGEELVRASREWTRQLFDDLDTAQLEALTEQLDELAEKLRQQAEVVTPRLTALRGGG